MRGREFIKRIINAFFIAVTLINILLYFMGGRLQGDAQFGYEVFLFPVLYGLAGVIPAVVIYSKHELTIKELLVRKFIQMILAVIIVVSIILGKSAFLEEYRSILIGLIIGVSLVFILVNVIQYFLELLTATSLTKNLKKFQENS